MAARYLTLLSEKTSLNLEQFDFTSCRPLLGVVLIVTKSENNAYGNTLTENSQITRAKDNLAKNKFAYSH